MNDVIITGSCNCLPNYLYSPILDSDASDYILLYIMVFLECNSTRTKNDSVIIHEKNEGFNDIFYSNSSVFKGLSGWACSELMLKGRGSPSLKFSSFSFVPVLQRALVPSGALALLSVACGTEQLQNSVLWFMHFLSLFLLISKRRRKQILICCKHLKIRFHMQ